MIGESSRDGRVSLREMQISVNTATALSAILSTPYKNIVVLDLSKNLLGDRGVAILAPALAKSKSLVTL